MESIYNREVINYDQTLALGFSKEILSCIISYNASLCRLRGFFTEYGMGVLNFFQREYDDNLKESKLSSKLLNKAETIYQHTRQKFGIKSNDDIDEESDSYNHRLSVMEFLTLKPELRQCAERIGHLALYDNASDLIHSDPTLAYILEIEGGGSAGLWATFIHDTAGAFSEDTDTMEMWEDFRILVRNLLIKLDEYKNSEYRRIVIHGDSSVVPKYYIKKAGSFMRQTTTVEEYSFKIDE